MCRSIVSLQEQLERHEKWKPGPMTILQTSVQTASFSTHIHAAAEMAKNII
jgi:hypothetical protein